MPFLDEIRASARRLAGPHLTGLWVDGAGPFKPVPHGVAVIGSQVRAVLQVGERRCVVQATWQAREGGTPAHFGPAGVADLDVPGATVEVAVGYLSDGRVVEPVSDTWPVAYHAVHVPLTLLPAVMAAAAELGYDATTWEVPD